MDGHGAYGDPISEYVKKIFEKSLTQHPAFASDVKRAITEVILDIELELFSGKLGINCEYSGSTFNMIIIRGYHITVANVGDSRCTLVTRGARKGEFIGVPLSVDHKPEHEDEKCRIIESGGRVFPVKYPDGHVGPERVWLGDKDIPGLGMSRSLGDRVVHSVGVMSTPEFFERDLNPAEDIAVVVATDGLWTVLSDAEVAKHTISCREPSSVVGLLLREAHNRWLLAGDSVDDTTVCVAFLEGKRTVH